MNPETMSVQTLRRLLASKTELAIIDVREVVEADRGHIPDMTNVPRNRIEFRFPELVRDPSTPVVVYCDGESGRSPLAAQTLIRHGYRNVAVLEGGLRAWEKSGGSVATGNNVPSKAFGERIHHDQAVPRISPGELDAIMKTGKRIAIRDVRTPEEHAEACIPGGRSLPGFEFVLHAFDLMRDHDLIVLHCAGRTRGIIAVQTLRELGAKHVVALENGTIGWLLEGLSLAYGESADVEPASPESIEFAEVKARKLAAAEGISITECGELQELLDRTEENHYVFDVRGIHDFVQGHIKGSIGLPGGQAVQRMDDFIALRQAPIVLVAEGEAASCITAVWLKRMGCGNVSVLRGGLKAWRREGRSLSTGKDRATPLGWDQIRAATQMITAAELSARLAAGMKTRVLNVDYSMRYRQGHVPGADWLPRSWLEQRVRQQIPDTDSAIVCESVDGRQACYAAASLAALGYSDVRVLEAGTRGWRAAGFPLERSELGQQDDVLPPPYKLGERAMREYIDWEKRLTA